MIDRIPHDLLRHIFSFIPDWRELGRLSLVCKEWNHVAADNRLWKSHFLEKYRKKEAYLSKLESSSGVENNNNSTAFSFKQHFRSKLPIDANWSNGSYKKEFYPISLLQDVECFQFTDKLLFTGGMLGDVKVYEHTNRNDIKLLKSFEHLHEGIVWWLIVKGNYCATASNDCSVHILDITTLEILHKINLKHSVWAMDFDPELNMVVTGENSGVLSFINLTSGQFIAQHRLGQAVFDACLYALPMTIQQRALQQIGSPYSRDFILFCAVDGRDTPCLHKIELNTDKLKEDIKDKIQPLKDHSSTVTTLALKDNLLMSSSFDGKLVVWDILSGQRLFELNTSEGAWSIVLFENKLVIGMVGQVQVWDFNTQKRLATINTRHAVDTLMMRERISCMSVTPTKVYCSGNVMLILDFENGGATTTDKAPKPRKKEKKFLFF